MHQGEGVISKCDKGGGGVVTKLCHTKIGQSYFIKFNIFHDNVPITFHYFKFCQFLFLTTAKRFFIIFSKNQTIN